MKHGDSLYSVTKTKGLHGSGSSHEGFDRANDNQHRLSCLAGTASCSIDMSYALTTVKLVCDTSH